MSHLALPALSGLLADKDSFLRHCVIHPTICQMQEALCILHSYVYINAQVQKAPIFIRLNSMALYIMFNLMKKMHTYNFFIWNKVGGRVLLLP